VTGSELAESGDRDGSARLGSSGVGSGAGGSGGRDAAGVREEASAGAGGSGAGAREERVGSGAELGGSASGFPESGDGAGVRGEGVGGGAELVGSGSNPSSSSSSLPEGLDELGESESLDDLEGFDDLDGGYRVRPFWARTSTLVVFVVVLFVLSGAVTAWLRISDLQDRVDGLEAQTLAAESARLAAVPLAEDLASYDYRDLGGNFRVVKASATPHFAAQLRQLSAELGPQLQQDRAVAKATVRSAGVVRATSSSAVVAVFVDQTVTNSKTSAPRTERSRMELTLLKQGGVWRLDQAGEL
jgi:Mce-associated membrane protein